MHLETLTTLDRLPSYWTVSTITRFCESALRRSLHDREEGSIVKALASGQNLQIGERLWDEQRVKGGYRGEPESPEVILNLEKVAEQVSYPEKVDLYMPTP